jgi:GNAT superfamily N-acetyltransferase
MKFDIQIVPYRAEFRQRAARLRSAVLGATPALNEQYLDWKYERNPFPEATALFLALSGDRVVGMRGMFGTGWKFASGDIVAMPQDADVMVVPEYRGRGIYRAMDSAALALMANRGVTHMISMSANEANRAAATRLGWMEVGAYEYARRPVRGWPFGPEFTGRMDDAIRRRLHAGLLGKGQFHLFDRRTNHRSKSGTSWSGSRVDADRLSQVMERTAKSQPIYPLSSPEYLTWRYENPLSEYRFLYSGRDQVNGYLVLGKANPWHLWIVDMEAPDAGVARDLLSYAIRATPWAALDLWTVSLTALRTDLLEELAFRTIPPNRSPHTDGVFMVRSTAVGDMSLMLNGLSLTDVANWDLRMISSDAY